MAKTKFILSNHAKAQMFRRQLTEEKVWQVVFTPAQIIEEGEGQKIYQSVVEGYLLRVFINFEKQPPLIKTVYRTSKTGKYWQHES